MTTDAPPPPPSAVDDFRAPRPFCRSAQILIVVIATLLHAVFLSKAKPLQSANDRSRWCTVWSLVERGTFQIDEIRQRPGWDTIDLIHLDHHFYSTKPPLLTCVVAGITKIVQSITGWNLLDQTQSLTVVVLVIVNLIPFVLSLLAWIAILERISLHEWTRLFVLSIAAFGTLLTPFLMTLNNHTVAAASITFAIWGLLNILTKESPSLPAWPFLLTGFASSWAAANEVPALLFLAIAFLLAFRQSARLTLLYFLPAATIPLLALIVTNRISTGSWKPVYADYGTDKYRFVIDGIPSYWMQPHGVDRNLDSPLMYFVHCTVGHHGLISLTPIALFAIVGWLMGFRVRDRALRTMLWLGAFTSFVVLSFYMTRTQNYNYGGVSCGLRWALWLVPLWLVALVPVLDRFAGSRAMRVLAFMLAFVSMFSAWQPIDNPWRQPWLFQWMETRGWIDYSDPPLTLPKPLWSWFASIPKTHDGEPAWTEFRVAQPGLEPRLVRLTARRDSSSGNGERVEVEVRESWGPGGPPVRIRKLYLQRDPFERGAPPAEFLYWSDPNVTAAQQQADLAFVRGLPRKVPYVARAVRYLKSSLRREALKCTQAAAHVSFSEHETAPPKNYRCDVWMCDEIPFGTAQVEFHLTDPESGALLFHERWVVSDCSPKIPHEP